MVVYDHPMILIVQFLYLGHALVYMTILTICDSTCEKGPLT